MTTNRMGTAPARLLIDKGSGDCVGLERYCFSYYSNPTDTMREKFLNRAVREECIFDKLMSDPASLSVKQQLSLSRAHIRHRATKMRPRLKGG